MTLIQNQPHSPAFTVAFKYKCKWSSHHHQYDDHPDNYDDHPDDYDGHPDYYTDDQSEA